MESITLKSSSRIVLVGVLVGFAGDLMLYDQPPGISIPLFAAIILVALAIVARRETGDPYIWSNFWLALPILFLAAASAVRAMPFLRFLNIVGALILLMLLAYGLKSKPVTKLNLGGYITALLATSLVALLVPPPLLRDTLQELRDSDDETQPGGQTRRQMLRRVLVGIALALPFLCLFTLLFSSADLLFDKYLDDIIKDFTFGDLVGHTILTAILGWALIGGLGYALAHPRLLPARKKSGDSANPQASPLTSAQHFGGLLSIVESSIVLYSVNALFVVFVAIQFAALFGGETFLQSQDLTYSEYARRGFFELVTAALVTLGLLLALDFATRREAAAHNRLFIAGAGLMIALTIVMLASAFLRMALYQEVYGYTHLRLFTHVFMVWLAALFVFFVVILARRKTGAFASGALIVAIGYMVTLNALNPDAFIAQRNINRYQPGAELDMRYLGGLSADATPYLVGLLERGAYPEEIRAEAGGYLGCQAARLERRQDKAGWPSYHVSLNHAQYLLLDKYTFHIEAYEAFPAYRCRYTTAAASNGYESYERDQ